MAQLFVVHPENPQSRLLAQAGQLLAEGGLVAIPTDSSYAVVARLDDKSAADALRRLRGLDERHHLTLLCRDLAEISHFARVDNRQYRFLKLATPGAYTFILEATSEVPRRLMHPKRKTIGLRVPANPIALALLEELGEPIMSVTLIMPGDEYPLNDPEDIRTLLDKRVDAIIDGGYCGLEPTTVVDLTGDVPVLVRRGVGDFAPFE